MAQYSNNYNSSFSKGQLWVMMGHRVLPFAKSYHFNLCFAIYLPLILGRYWEEILCHSLASNNILII